MIFQKDISLLKPNCVIVSHDVTNVYWLLETAWQLLHKDFGAKFKLGMTLGKQRLTYAQHSTETSQVALSRQ